MVRCSADYTEVCLLKSFDNLPKKMGHNLVFVGGGQ